MEHFPQVSSTALQPNTPGELGVHSPALSTRTHIETRTNNLHGQVSEAAYEAALDYEFTLSAGNHGPSVTMVSDWYASDAATAGRWRAFARLSSDAGHACTTHFYANGIAEARAVSKVVSVSSPAQRPKVYRYVFQHTTANWPKRFLNATHASEVPYVFADPTDVMPAYIGYASFTRDESLLSISMAQAWASFAATGKPSTNNLVWPEFTPAPKTEVDRASCTHNCTMFFDCPASAARPYQHPQCDGHWRSFL